MSLVHDAVPNSRSPAVPLVAAAIEVQLPQSDIVPLRVPSVFVPVHTGAEPAVTPSSSNDMALSNVPSIKPAQLGAKVVPGARL